MNTFLGTLVITLIVVGWVVLFLRGTRWDVVDAVHRRRGPDTPQPEPVGDPAADVHRSDGPHRLTDPLLPRHPQLSSAPRLAHAARNPHGGPL